MHAQLLEADYLVVGTGAMGMAFTDTLVAESNATVVMVDGHGAPGGHWNEAYSFVRLHQPSAAYGVSSLPLGTDEKQTSGLNAGLYHSATGAEVLRYFADVMECQLLATGRVRYFPNCDYVGNGRFVSRDSKTEYEVRVDKAIVDATYTKTDVPGARAPLFPVADGIRCVPVNGLADETAKADKYVVLGAGKTAIDACLCLLERGVAPEDIRWVRSRDVWLHDRARLQPGDLSHQTAEGLALTMEAAAAAESVEDLFARLCASRQLLRIDEDVTPMAYRCAMVSEAELVDLRRIKDVIRLGRVRRIDVDEIVLERGSVPTRSTSLHVDCTAHGIPKRPQIPVFAPGSITLQPVRVCQPTFSAALTGFVESIGGDLSAKNTLCSAIPYPDCAIDWLRGNAVGTANEYLRSKNEAVRKWTERTRLNVYGDIGRKQYRERTQPFMARFAQSVGPAVANLQRLMASAQPRP